VIDSLEANLLDTLTSKLTDSTARSLVDAAFPKVQAILEQERNRLVNSLTMGIPFGAASAITATLTYYYAQTNAQKAIGYSLAAAIAGGGGIAVLLGLKSQDQNQVQTQTKSSSLDPYIEAAAQTLIAQADPKVRAIIAEERTRVTSSLQTALPWGVGGALAALATVFAIPDGLDALKILGWLIAIVLSAYGSWLALQKMSQKPV